MCVYVLDDDDVDDAWKSLGRGRRLLFKHFIGHCVTTIVCLQTYRSSLLNKGKEMGCKCRYLMLIEHKTNNTR